MKIQPVIELLAPAGLGAPLLRALVPNEDNYSVLLLQPRGHIEATAAGVRHQDRDLARNRFCSFLQDARTTNADLAVTPEYSLPWETLVAAIKAGHAPANGALWALGCESIKYAELEALRQNLAPHAIVFYELLQPDPQRFVDPLAYVFWAPSADGSGPAQLALLVQFKTCPMGDNDHFEINGLQRGTRVYQFGGTETSIRLISLICSDVFAFSDEDARAVYDRALVLHIQLNPKPRQDQYRQYRTRLLGFRGNETELLCLNWAQDVHEVCGVQTRCWNNIAGSAWYLRPDTFDDRDHILSTNHQHGLYYTWHPSLRSHVLFFNYEPAMYLLTATKVAHIGVTGSLSHRRGPQLTAMRVWDDAASAWIDHMTPADGFSAVVSECGQAQGEIMHLAANNPFAAERVLALCAGKIGDTDGWHNVRQLDSCVIGPSEVIRRMTFCQDTDADARAFRIDRLNRCRRLWEILRTDGALPPAIADLRTGCRLEWTPDSPHQNVISAEGRRATAIYMGEEANGSQIEAVAKRLAEYLHRSSADPDKSIEARQRLHVWYRNNNGTIELFDRGRYLQYDDPRSTSEFDIARAQ